MDDISSNNDRLEVFALANNFVNDFSEPRRCGGRVKALSELRNGDAMASSLVALDSCGVIRFDCDGVVFKDGKKLEFIAASIHNTAALVYSCRWTRYLCEGLSGNCQAFILRATDRSID